MRRQVNSTRSSTHGGGEGPRTSPAGGGLLVAAFALISAAHWLAGLVSYMPLLGDTIGWLLVLMSPMIIAPVTFGLLFKFLPPVRLAWRDVWLAAVLAGAAWIIGTEILSLCVAYVGDSFSAYGAVGGVLVVMLWLYVVSQVLFFGAELCKVVAWSSSSEPT